jgi:hypothetical protein
LKGNISKQVQRAINVSVTTWNRILLDNYLILEFELPFADFNLTEETEIFFFNSFQNLQILPTTKRSIPWFDESTYFTFH